MKITTSWDDGHLLDLRLAELLDKYGLKGTFYIAKAYVNPRMSESELCELATRHELGAHTLTHPSLSQVSLKQAREEIFGSKQWLEDVLSQEVTAFCYPRGDYNADVRQLVQEAHFKMARTVEGFQLGIGQDMFCVPTTLQVYPYPLRQTPYWRLKLQPLQRALPHLVRLKLSPLVLFSWQELAHATLTYAQKHDSLWHLWGHSWEIDQYQLWQPLENLLKTLTHYSFQAVTNTESIIP
jgi:peptidoglycan-N-acetylglucosamine deacetylase